MVVVLLQSPEANLHKSEGALQDSESMLQMLPGDPTGALLINVPMRSLSSRSDSRLVPSGPCGFFSSPMPQRQLHFVNLDALCRRSMIPPL